MCSVHRFVLLMGFLACYEEHTCIYVCDGVYKSMGAPGFQYGQPRVQWDFSVCVLNLELSSFVQVIKDGIKERLYSVTHTHTSINLLFFVQLSYAHTHAHTNRINLMLQAIMLNAQ